jgi:hypothetical protein
MDGHDLTFVDGLGKADQCVASDSHSPVPLRFVWHHVQPQEAGGQTIASNLIEICDSCHYSIHRLMWNMAVNQPNDLIPRRMQLHYATVGYAACVAAGTVAQIPNEG